MQHHHAVIGEHIVHLVEELFVVQAADMFEHSDGDDAIVALGRRQVIIVLQLETDAVGETPPGGSFAGNLQLLGRQRDAGHVDAGAFRQIHRHAAPAGADFQRLLAGLCQKLCHDMAFLGDLRLVQ
ncbi:hypothetical protein D3C87_1572200 [compost metagenome]